MKTAFHLLLVIFFSSGSAFAWSSAASRTQHHIKQIALAIESYQYDTGHLPPSATWREDLQKEGNVEPRIYQDAWKQGFVYRAPGAQGRFDLYSIGPDGIDNRGAGDDVTESGVNDGYHWKKTWPEGRRVLKFAILLGTLGLLFGFYFRWSIVVPTAGIVTGLIMIRGCILLQHPGITPRNDTLGGIVFLLTLFLLGCLYFLFRALRQPAVASNFLPSFLSEAQIRELLAPLEGSQKLQVVRYRSSPRTGQRHSQEMTASELEDIILHSVAAKRLPGGNLAVQLPGHDRTLIGNPDGLYWLNTNA